MRHEQGGCTPRCQTKKQLKEVVRDIPEKLYLSSTTADFLGGGWSGRATELPEDVTFTVVGPDPERNRRWYANVKCKNGRVTVS